MQSPRSQYQGVCIAAFVTIALCILAVEWASCQVFSENVQVDDGVPYAQYAPSIARGPRGELYVLFDDMREGGDMYFARSLDEGRTWSKPNIRVSDACICGWGLSSCLVVDDVGTIYACWSDKRDDRNIYFSRSTDGGDTWSVNVQVNESSSGGKYDPSLVLPLDHSLCVVWSDFRNGVSDSDIYFARSTDGGETWTDPNIRVDDGSVGDQSCPRICADHGGDLYVGYNSRPDGEEDYHLYLVRSTDYGETWSAPAYQIDDGYPADHWQISLKVSPVGLYAAWRVYGGGLDNIVFAKSTDWGETWSEPVQVDHIGSGLWSEQPDLAIGEDGVLYVTWARSNVYGDAQTDVFFGLSTDDGQTWTDPSIRVNDFRPDAQEDPKLVLGSDQNVYIVWEDCRNRTPDDPIDIYFSRTVPVLAYGEAEDDTVAAGGNLGVTITLVNTTGVDQTADIWTGMMLLTGGMYRKGTMMYGPEAFSLTPYDTLFEHIEHEIPGDTPPGEYEYWVKVDEYRPIYDPPHRLDTDEDRYYLFKDSFTFTVVEGVVSGHGEEKPGFPLSRE
jgi:hypothetical protein